MEIKGTVHEVTEVMQVTDSLSKCELILEYIENPQYPEYLKFQALNSRVDLVKDLAPGDEVTLHFNLKGRPWTSKEGKKTYFNSMDIWRVEAKTQAYPEYKPEGGGTVVVGKGVPEYAAPVNLSAAPGEDDDLPF